MSYFKSQLPQSNRVVDCTVALLEKYLSCKCERALEEPSTSNPHPVDMWNKTKSGTTYGYEIKREGRSRQTGNVFFEANGLSAAKACGAQFLWMWIDGAQTYIDVDLGILITWLQTQDKYYKANAGDAKRFGYSKANPGWAIPIKVLFEQGPLKHMNIGDKDGKICKGFGKYFWHEGDETWAAVSRLMS
tara:strand:+ start:281 stop:847 length:567 start_codon:yes stop_codon:yes gene_type:complete